AFAGISFRCLAPTSQLAEETTSQKTGAARRLLLCARWRAGLPPEQPAATLFLFGWRLHRRLLSACSCPALRCTIHQLGKGFLDAVGAIIGWIIVTGRKRKDRIATSTQALGLANRCFRSVTTARRWSGPRPYGLLGNDLADRRQDFFHSRLRSLVRFMHPTLTARWRPRLPLLSASRA